VLLHTVVVFVPIDYHVSSILDGEILSGASGFATRNCAIDAGLRFNSQAWAEFDETLAQSPCSGRP